MSRIYTTVQGDMWDMIAYKEMGSVDYTDDLMNANSSLLSYFSFPAGVMLTIPDVVERSASTLPAVEAGAAMSSRNLARRTKAEVSFGGIDITKSIQPYLLSISYTDNEEDETDDLQIKIQDRDDLWLTQWLDEISEKLSWASPSGGSASGDAVVSEANKYLGTPYVWGGSSPSGFDCSGLVYYALNEAGISVPRTTAQGYKDMATPVNEATAQPGDLIFFGTQGVVDHVGIYMGNGQMVNATGSCVQITDINTRRAGIISWGRIGGATQSGSAASAQAGTQSSGSGSSTSSGEQGASSDGGGAEERLAMDVVFVRENWNSDGSDAVLPCGEFELDNISCSGPPNTVCIKGSSIPFSSQLRQTCKSKAWESYTLSGIANEIAGSGGMTCMYESDSDPYYERVEQIDMSDIEFLSQLCHDAGISLKATNRILVLFDQRKYEQKPEVRTIKRYDHSYKTYQLSTSAADAQYASCRVSYVNPETGQCIEGIAKVEGYTEDPNNQQLEITAKVGTVDEAKELAEKNLRLRNKFCRQAQFLLPGDTDLVAGVNVALKGWGGYDGKYIIKQAVHKLDSGGYTTQISLRMVLEGY